MELCCPRRRAHVTDKSVHTGGVPTPDDVPPPGASTRIFDKIYPLVILVAAFGLLPIAWKPVRVSFDPRRSTLLYVVAVQGAVLWSVRTAIVARARVFVTPGASLLQRFTSLTSLGWLGSVAILPVAWAECRKPRRFLEMSRPLEVGVTRSSTFVEFPLEALVVAPPYVAGWLMVVAPDGADWTHFLGHLYQILISTTCVGCVAGTLLTVADFATGLKEQLATELLAGGMTATRVREFRMAWVRLRQLSEGCVAMPTTVLALLMYLIMQTTLCTYQGLVSSLAGFHTFASICAIISVQIFAGVVIMCDAGHRAAQAAPLPHATSRLKLIDANYCYVALN
ncbi:Gustatory receptor 22, partial [Frankliniella occidentalis]